MKVQTLNSVTDLKLFEHKISKIELKLYVYIAFLVIKPLSEALKNHLFIMKIALTMFKLSLKFSRGKIHKR